MPHRHLPPTQTTPGPCRPPTNVPDNCLVAVATTVPGAPAANREEPRPLGSRVYPAWIAPRHFGDPQPVPWFTDRTVGWLLGDRAAIGHPHHGFPGRRMTLLGRLASTETPTTTNTDSQPGPVHAGVVRDRSQLTPAGAGWALVCPHCATPITDPSRRCGRFCSHTCLTRYDTQPHVDNVVHDADIAVVLRVLNWWVAHYPYFDNPEPGLLLSDPHNAQRLHRFTCLTEHGAAMIARELDPTTGAGDQRAHGFRMVSASVPLPLECREVRDQWDNVVGRLWLVSGPGWWVADVHDFAGNNDHYEPRLLDVFADEQQAFDAVCRQARRHRRR